MAVLVGIALLMTVGVYGLVAGIVKLDDAGLHLSRAAGAQAWAGFKRALGRGILRAAPWLMKALSVAGTAAMFLVGGGILVHGVPWLHHGIEAAAAGRGRRTRAGRAVRRADAQPAECAGGRGRRGAGVAGRKHGKQAAPRGLKAAISLRLR